MRACATGSPASTRSTKLTPLTTRPSFTSRQGMTRILSMGLGRERQSGGEVDPPVIERAAENGAANAVRRMRLQRLQILERGYAAGCDHRRVELLCKLGGPLDIGARQCAVALDIGENNRRDAGILKFQGEIKRGHGRGLGPAFNRDLAIARVDPDRDARWKEAARLADQARVVERRGAENDARHAAAEPSLDGREIANAATELNGNADGIEDCLDACAIDGLAGESAVEIDNVEPAA